MKIFNLEETDLTWWRHLWESEDAEERESGVREPTEEEHTDQRHHLITQQSDHKLHFPQIFTISRTFHCFRIIFFRISSNWIKGVVV